MSVLGLVAAMALGGVGQRRHSIINPALWLNPNGSLLVEGKGAPARQTKGAQMVQTPFGLGLDLDGTHGDLLLGDLPALALSDSLTVSTWVYLRSYVNSGPGAQILFRGDDRNGLDPYYLVVRGEHTVLFGINDAQGNAAEVSTEIPLKTWVRVTASFDAGIGEQKLWMNDRLVGTHATERRPFTVLDRGYAPGVGIGNVQNNLGSQNQPLNGLIADLRLYAEPLAPDDAGRRPFSAD